MWAFPFNQHKMMIFQLLGTRRLIRGNDPSDLVMLASYSWMGRGYYMSQMGYHIENEALADRYEIKTRLFWLFTMVAFIFGLVVAYYFTLHSYYNFGALTLGDKSGVEHVERADGRGRGCHRAPRRPAPIRARHRAGAAITVIMVLRFYWLQSLFHPLATRSRSTRYCGRRSCSWIVKLACSALGARLYRQLMPFFLGLVMDLLAGGLSWRCC